MPESGVDLKEPASLGSTPLEVVVMSRLNQSPILPKLNDLNKRTPTLASFREQGGLDRKAVSDLFGFNEISQYREEIKAKDTGMKLVGEATIDGSSVTMFEGVVSLQTGSRTIAQLCVVEGVDGSLSTFTLFKKEEGKSEGQSLSEKIKALRTKTKLAETLLKVQKAAGSDVRIDLNEYEGLVAAEWGKDNESVDVLALHEPFTEFGRALQYEVYQDKSSSAMYIRSLLYEASQNIDNELERRLRDYLDHPDEEVTVSSVKALVDELEQERAAIEQRGDEPVPHIPNLFIRLNDDGKVVSEKLEEVHGEQ